MIQRFFFPRLVLQHAITVDKYKFPSTFKRPKLFCPDCNIQSRLVIVGTSSNKCGRFKSLKVQMDFYLLVFLLVENRRISTPVVNLWLFIKRTLMANLFLLRVNSWRQKKLLHERKPNRHVAEFQSQFFPSPWFKNKKK